MLRLKTAVSFAVAALVAAAAFIAFLAFKPEQVPTLSASAPAVRESQAGSPTTSSAPALQRPAPMKDSVVADKSTRSALLQGFNSYTDGRVFVEQSWKLPQFGGRFYAAKVVEECQALRLFNSAVLSMAQPETSVVGASSYLQASSALQVLQRRCGQLTADDYQRFSSQVLSIEAGQDLLDTAARRITGLLKEEKDRALAWQALMASSDPVLVQDFARRLALHSNSQDGVHYYLDGTKYRAAGNEVMEAAFLLLPCGLGLSCDARDGQLAIRCVTGGGCYADRYDYVQRSMLGNDPEKYRDVLRIYQRLVEIFKVGAVTSLVPP
jgi:DNA-directed RNA polymerase subunit N (RpoN/RPB10)